MLNSSSEEESFLNESASKDICTKGELPKIDVASMTEPARYLGDECSKRDEDSDESTLLEPPSGTSASLQSTLEDLDEARRGIGDPDDPCPQRPRYCTGCSPLRIVMSPMAILVLGLVGMTYYAYVVETSDASIIELLLFHVLIALLVGCEVPLGPRHRQPLTARDKPRHSRQIIAISRSCARPAPLPPAPIAFHPVGSAPASWLSFLPTQPPALAHFSQLGGPIGISAPVPPSHCRSAPRLPHRPSAPRRAAPHTAPRAARRDRGCHGAHGGVPPWSRRSRDGLRAVT